MSDTVTEHYPQKSIIKLIFHSKNEKRLNTSILEFII